jgi:DNA-binding NarL/FixJ family response regulator
MNILLVDDHALFRAGMRMLLGGIYQGATIWEAGAIAEAVALAKEHPEIDVCLLDLAFRDESGLAGLQLIKGTAPKAALIVVSAAEDSATIRACIDRGAMSFIPKSLGPAVLTQALRHVLAGAVYLPEQITGSDNIAPAPQLTPRQLDVLRCLSRALPTKLIARELQLSEHTVKEHIALIFAALGVHNRTEAVIRSSQLRLLEGPKL